MLIFLMEHQSRSYRFGMRHNDVRSDAQLFAFERQSNFRGTGKLLRDFNSRSRVPALDNESLLCSVSECRFLTRLSEVLNNRPPFTDHSCSTRHFRTGLEPETANWELVLHVNSHVTAFFPLLRSAALSRYLVDSRWRLISWPNVYSWVRMSFISTWTRGFWEKSSCCWELHSLASRGLFLLWVPSF